MDVLWVGKGTYINNELVVSITEFKHPQAKKHIKAAKENGSLLDYTAGEKTESVLLLSNGIVVMSILEPYEIVEWLKENK